MKVTIKINCENSAFEEMGEGPEAARMLRELAGKLEQTSLAPGDTRNLRDMNGNICGVFKVTR